MKEFLKIKGWLEKFPFLTIVDFAYFKPFLKSKMVEEQRVILEEGQSCRKPAMHQKTGSGLGA
ncbi:MAG: hypothetical protein WCH05_09660 [Chlorobiaceae bacterium]